jgi:imidazolonepropionase-like amidohydrolase
MSSLRFFAPFGFLRCAVVCLILGLHAHAEEVLAIRHVTVIGGANGRSLERAAVVIRGDRITSVGPDRTIQIPANARILDGRGKFLVPGFIDMHAHLSKTRASSLGLFVVHGITTVRDMGGDHEELLRWRREIRSGDRVGPSMLIAGPYLESAGNVARMRSTPPEELAEPVERTRVSVDSPEEARRIVGLLATRQVDHIKIRTVQDRETYMAIGEAARSHKLPLVGHAFGISPEDILASGQQSIEHVLFPTLDEMSDDARLALFRRFAARGIGIVPTLVTFTKSIFPPDDALQAIVQDTEGRVDARRRFLSRFLVMDWREQAQEQTAERRAQMRPVYLSSLRNLREMRRAGVRIMAGSDVAVLNIFPGSSLHEELELMVNELAMTPAEAIDSTTIRSAEFVGLGQSVGSVSEGRIADLVLLEANPLVDIRNTRAINAVVLRGRVFDRADLDGLLKGVAASEDVRVNDWPRVQRP